MRARITHTSQFAKRGRARVLRIRSDQFRHRQYGFVMFATRFDSSLDITSVLTFVELGHAFEPVIGIEASRPKEGRSRGLNSKPEMNHGINFRMSTDEIEDLWNRVPRLATREVDRIASAPARRDELVAPAHPAGCP